MSNDPRRPSLSCVCNWRANAFRCPAASFGASFLQRQKAMLHTTSQMSNDPVQPSLRAFGTGKPRGSVVIKPSQDLVIHSHALDHMLRAHNRIFNVHRRLCVNQKSCWFWLFALKFSCRTCSTAKQSKRYVFVEYPLFHFVVGSGGCGCSLAVRWEWCKVKLDAKQ